MYINIQGNVFAVCRTVAKAQYYEESGQNRKELTRISVIAKEKTAYNVQDVPLELLFYEDMAIPAMKIGAGQYLEVTGHEMSREKRIYGRNKLRRTLIVTSWRFREIDPGAMQEALKTRREIAAREKEFRQLFAEYLTECKPYIVNWVLEAAKEESRKREEQQEQEQEQDEGNGAT